MFIRRPTVADESQSLTNGTILILSALKEQLNTTANQRACLFLCSQTQDTFTWTASVSAAAVVRWCVSVASVAAVAVVKWCVYVALLDASH